MTDSTATLEVLPNVGVKLAAALRRAGIATPAQLKRVGAVAAWQRIHPEFTCLHSLQALEGAVRGIPKSRLDAATRARLAEVVRADRYVGFCTQMSDATG